MYYPIYVTMYYPMYVNMYYPMYYPIYDIYLNICKYVLAYLC